MRHRRQSAARSRGPARARVLRVAGCGVVESERVALLQNRRRCTVPGLWGHVALSQRWLRDGVIPELGFEVSAGHGPPPRPSVVWSPRWCPVLAVSRGCCHTAGSWESSGGRATEGAHGCE